MLRVLKGACYVDIQIYSYTRKHDKTNQIKYEIKRLDF